MGRSARAAWAVDVVAVGAAVCVLVLVGPRPFGDPPLAPGTTLALVFTWVAAAAAALVTAVALIGRRPPKMTGTGAVALTLVIAGVATLDVAPAIRVLAVALGAGVTLAIAMFVATVLDERPRRSGLLAVTVASIVAVAARIVARDPLQDLRCAPYCGNNPLLVGGRPEWVTAADRALAIVGLGWCAISVAGIARSRSSAWSRASAAAALGAVAVASSISLVKPGTSMWDGSTSWTRALIPAALLTAFLLAAGPHAQVWHTRIQARDLASALADSMRSDGVATHLQNVVRDPSIRLLFPSAADTYIGPDGQTVQPRSQLATTTVERDGTPIALIEHKPSSSAQLAAALSPPVIVAVENERLHSLAEAELADLRTSRRRIVERADEARRRLERDLHDGAQQRLLLLGMELARAANSADDGHRKRYVEAIGHTQEALAELRNLVHARRPPVLDELGLVEALRTLGETAPLPLLIELDASLDHRPPRAVERVAYGLVLSMIHDGEAAGASKVSIRLAESGAGSFTFILGHDAEPTLDTTDDEDQVGAVGGSLRVTASSGGIEYLASFP